MQDIWIIVILYAVGLLILVAELFLPSHGVLTVAALAFLGFAVVKTFRYGTFAGTAAVLACMTALPIMALLAVKIWPRTPIGKLMAPLNPVASGGLDDVETRSLELLLGKYGQSVSPLRPVGICEFGGRRVECVAEMGMIEPGQCVQAIELRSRTLAVRKVEPKSLLS